MTNKIEIGRELAMNSKRILELVELLGEVAHTAFQLADNSEDRGDEVVVQMTDFTALSDALDACDELPELDDVYVRDGWLRALDELRALIAQAEMWNPHPAEAHLASLLIVLGSAGIKVSGGTHGDPWTVAASTCETCDNYGQVGNILNAEPCPDCTPVPPLIQTLHANGDRIAMEATIAQQAQRIADLEGAAVVERQEPVAWGAPKTIRQLIQQLETLDQDLRPVSILRVPGSVFEDGKDRSRAVHLSISHERVEGQWLSAFKGDGEKVVAFWCRIEQPAPVSEACTSCDGSGEYIDAIGDWRGYCSCPSGVALKNKPAPVAVVPVEIHKQLVEMRQQFERANFVQLGKLLTVCLDKVKELNQ